LINQQSINHLIKQQSTNQLTNQPSINGKNYDQFQFWQHVIYQQYDHQYITALGNRLVNGICSKLAHVTRNGDPDHTYLGCVNLSFACVEGESLLMALKDIALSSGRYDFFWARRDYYWLVIIGK